MYVVCMCMYEQVFACMSRYVYVFDFWGHERVFWGRCGGFRAPAVQYIQYLQIQITYICIHANTYIYLHIPTCSLMQETATYLLQ